MFWHNFCYFFKVLLKNKMLIFWTLAFPIILGTFFNMAFANLMDSEKLKVIDIAIVDNEEFNNNILYKTAFSMLSDENSNERLFNTKYVSLEEAEDLLNEKEIEGYLNITDEPVVVINSNGINGSVFKSVVTELYQINNLVDVEDANNYETYMNIYAKYSQEIEFDDKSSNNLNYVMLEFYSLIAMTALYGGSISLFVTNQMLPNLSSKGKRIGISPVSKFKLLFSGLMASYIVQLVGLAILFLYTVFVLNIEYGTNLPLIILLSIVGSFAGLALGVLISLLVKKNEDAKIGVLVAFTMTGCFFAGMMSPTIQYEVNKAVPFLNKINPANMITDGLYSLYYYDTYDRYFFNLISLLVFTAIIVLISYFVIRRQKYDSI